MVLGLALTARFAGIKIDLDPSLRQLIRNSATTLYEILPSIACVISPKNSGKSIFDLSRLSELHESTSARRRQTSFVVLPSPSTTPSLAAAVPVPSQEPLREAAQEQGPEEVASASSTA
jgi:hypothetical protein